MVIGLNLPDTSNPLSDAHWARFRQLRIGQFTVSSQAHSETLERLSDDFPHAWIHVRPSIAPQAQTAPAHALDCRSGGRSRSLGECLESLRRGFPPERLFWVGGTPLTNEPGNAGSAGGLGPRLDLDAIQSYAVWWGEAVEEILRQFPGVQVAVGPLGQGAPELQWCCFRALKRLGCYDQATYLADHNAFFNRPYGDREWGGRGVALRELLPELGLVHNLQAHDAGHFAAVKAPQRADVYSGYLDWCRRSGSYACVSLSFPSAQDDASPQTQWHTLPPLILSTSVGADDAQETFEVNNPGPWNDEPEPRSLRYRGQKNDVVVIRAALKETAEVRNHRGLPSSICRTSLR